MILETYKISRRLLAHFGDQPSRDNGFAHILGIGLRLRHDCVIASAIAIRFDIHEWNVMHFQHAFRAGDSHDAVDAPKRCHMQPIFCSP